MEPTSHKDVHAAVAGAPLEELGLGVRTRNALKGFGRLTIADVLRLDLARPVRGLGRMAREELLLKLERAGHTHPAAERVNEITRLERHLERMQHRIDSTLRAVSKEIRAARQMLNRLRVRAPEDTRAREG